MKKIFLLAGAMTMLVLSSCKKDKDSDGDNNGGNAKLLKKVTKTENGATTVFNLIYEGGKLKSFGSADGLESTILTYNGSNDITKIEVRDHNDYTTYTYTYNNGNPVSGTVQTIQKVAGEPDDISVDDELTYTVVNNQVTQIKKVMKIAEAEQTANLTYGSDGNLAKVMLEGDMEGTVNFTWGTKKSGFPAVLKWVLDIGYTLQFFAKNEMITAAFDFDGTMFDYTLTTQYTYDKDGYPLTSDDGETQLKFEYQ